MPKLTTAFRCGVCRQELRGIWAVLTARPFPICSRCRLLVHHGCLAESDPPICRRCIEGPASPPGPASKTEGATS